MTIQAINLGARTITVGGDDGDCPALVALAHNCTIVVNGLRAGLGLESLAVGSRCSITIQNGKAIRINATG